MASLWNNYTDVQKMGLGMGAGSLGAGIAGMFGDNSNPADEAQKYYKQIPGQLHQNFDPWVQYGQQLTQDPGGRLNQIGQGYQQSPGFQFALQQALQGAGHAAAAGGMAGSPQHEQQNMQLGTNIANQDYYNWLKNTLGLHQQGYQQGQEGGMGLGEDLASVLAQRGKLGYEGQVSQNQQEGGMWGNLLGGAGMLAAFL